MSEGPAAPFKRLIFLPAIFYSQQILRIEQKSNHGFHPVTQYPVFFLNMILLITVLLNAVFPTVKSSSEKICPKNITKDQWIVILFSVFLR